MGARVRYSRVAGVVCLWHLTCSLVYSFVRDYAVKPICNIIDEQDAS
jgi:hypothetical protein